MDIAYPFLYHLEEDEDFIAAFPDPSDHLDLHSLRARCIKGHYKSDANAREGFATALDMLFTDLYRMVRNGKQYNSHNSEFQVWRLCDMFEKALNRLQGALQGATEASGHQSLAKKGRLNEGQENAACTPVKQVMRASVDDEFWNECEDV